MLGLAYLYAQALLSKWVLVVTGGLPLIADQIAQLVSVKWRKWVEDKGPWRRRIEVAFLLSAVVWAGFEAWQDEYTGHQKTISDLNTASGRAAYWQGIAQERATEIGRLTREPASPAATSTPRLGPRAGRSTAQTPLPALPNKPVTAVQQPTLQATAPVLAPPSPPSTPIERHLTRDQKQTIIDASADLKTAFRSVHLYWINNNGETLGIADDFLDAFGRAGLKPDRVLWSPDGPDQTGVMIGAIDPAKPSAAEKKLHAILLKIGFAARYILRQQGDTDGVAEIYLGPLPL